MVDLGPDIRITAEKIARKVVIPFSIAATATSTSKVCDLPKNTRISDAEIWTETAATGTTVTGVLETNEGTPTAIITTADLKVAAVVKQDAAVVARKKMPADQILNFKITETSGAGIAAGVIMVELVREDLTG